MNLALMLWEVEMMLLALSCESEKYRIGRKCWWGVARRNTQFISVLGRSSVFCYRCNDGSSPLSRASLQQCHSVTNIPWQLYCRDEPRMSRCSICLQQWRVILSLHVTTDISPGLTCGHHCTVHWPLPGSHVNHKHQIISKDFRKGV